MKTTNNNKLSIFLKGLIAENPVLVLVLGTCPALAQTGSVIDALGMGVAATLVLLCSNMVISSLRKIIPDTVRIPCYMKQSYEDFFAPVFVLNAINRSLLSGNVEKVNRVEEI